MKTKAIIACLLVSETFGDFVFMKQAFSARSRNLWQYDLLIFFTHFL
jgi:hypothetical protein